MVVGAVFLALPISHEAGKTVHFIDALFTSASALYVTGLATVDTASTWSRFGEVVIMLLIQSGGLGVVTLGTLVAIALGKRVGYRERLRIAAQVSALQTGGVIRLIRTIFLLAVCFELLGALLLYPLFASRHGPAEGAFYALFHAVSAFNNAGFALYPNNLMDYVANPLVTLVIAGLIILGGLGFIVHINIGHFYFGKCRVRLNLHTRIVLLSTAILLGAGTLGILLFEWGNPSTLGELPLHGKLLAAFFQGVTPRTAGFNTLDYTALHESSLLLTMLLMFIGGSPASTAGGIKTVSWFIIVASVWSIAKGRGELVIFGRRVTNDIVVRAGGIALLSFVSILSALFLLSFTEHKPLFALAFEATSAFGTVGLTLDTTPYLTLPGKLIIIILMFVGRIGPLTFALALFQDKPSPNPKHPEEGVLIG